MSDMGFRRWVLDVSFWKDGEPNMFAWCPYTDEDEIMTGLTILSGPAAPGPMYAIVHEAGQDAVERWMATHPAELAELSAANVGVQP